MEILYGFESLVARSKSLLLVCPTSNVYVSFLGHLGPLRDYKQSCQSSAVASPVEVEREMCAVEKEYKRQIMAII